MNINDAFPSDYLKAADLRGKKVKVQISHVEMKKLGDDNKPVLFFEGKEKGMVLNKTNAQIIAASYGSDTKEWGGTSLWLYPTKVNFNNQMVEAIRVEVPVEVAADDDVPFR